MGIVQTIKSYVQKEKERLDPRVWAEFGTTYEKGEPPVTWDIDKGVASETGKPTPQPRPGGGGGGGGGTPTPTPTPTPSSAPTPPPIDTQKIKEAEYTRQQLMNLGTAGGINRWGGESDSSYEQRAISYGRGLAYGYPDLGKSYTGRGSAFVSPRVYTDLEDRRNKLLEDIKQAGMNTTTRDPNLDPEVQRLRRELKQIDKISGKVGTGVVTLAPPKKEISTQPLFKISKPGEVGLIGVNIPGVIQRMKGSKSPQERVADWLIRKDVDLTKFEGEPNVNLMSLSGFGKQAVGDIARYEKLLKEKREKGIKATTLGVLGKGIVRDVKEGTEKFSDVVTSWVGRRVEKIPIGVRKKIVEAPSFIGGKVYEKTGAKRTIQESVGLMKTIPAPSEWGWVQKGVTSNVSIPTAYGNIKVQPSKPIIDIEKQYQKEIKKGVIEPGRYRFLSSTLGKGYEQAGTGISETYLMAKKGKLISPFKEPIGGYSPESKFIGKVSGFIGESQVYAVPVVRTIAIVAPFAEATGRRELKTYVKKHPMETVFATAFIGAQTLRGVKYLGKPIIRAQSIEGRFRILKKPKTYISKPFMRTEQISPTGKLFVQEVRGLKTAAGISVPGQKTLVTTKFRDILGVKPIYEGIPYGEIGKKTYKQALTYLTKRGYTKAESVNLLRYRFPKVFTQASEGVLKISALGEQKPIFEVKVFQKEKPIKIKTKEFTTLGKKGEVKKIEVSGEVGKKDFLISDIETKKAVLGKKGEIYSPINIRGKTTEQFKQVSKAKELLVGEESILYDVKALTRKVVPYKKVIMPSKTKVYIQKGEPLFTKRIESPIKVTKLPITAKPVKKIEFTQERAKSFIDTLKRVYGKPETPTGILKTYSPLVTEKQLAEIGAINILKAPTPIPKITIKKIPATRITQVSAPLLTKLEDTDTTKLFPGFSMPTTQFGTPTGKISPFETGKIKGLGTFKGRIPSGTLERLSTIKITREEEKLITKLQQLTKLKSKQLTKVQSRNIEREMLRIKQTQVQLQKQKQLPKQMQVQMQVQKQLQIQKPIQQQILKQTTTKITPLIPIIPPPVIPLLSTEPLITKMAAKKVIRGGMGYDAYAQQKGKWYKLNKVPLTQSQAKDLQSYIVDTSLSARGKIRPSNKPIKKSKLNIPTGYYGRTRNKYRDYMKKGKKKIKLKDEWIEHRKHRLDIKNESQSIQAARRKLLGTSGGRRLKWF